MLRQFIIIDDNRDGCFVLSRALFRHYPAATLHEFRDFASAREALANLPPDGGAALILLHRIPNIGGAQLVRAVREIHDRVPIVALGDPELGPEVLAAGATRFLDYEAWLRLGTLVKGLDPGDAKLTEKSSA
jgi:FixJ family two-component response regulator